MKMIKQRRIIALILGILCAFSILLFAGSVRSARADDASGTGVTEFSIVSGASARIVESANEQSGKRLNLYNAHLDNRSSLARENGIKLILERAKTDGTTIIAGDFNTKDDSECYKIISSAMKDCQKAAERTQCRNTFHKWGEIVDGKPIDFIFVDKRVKVLNFSISDSDRFIDENGERRFLSDHYAIKTELLI